MKSFKIFLLLLFTGFTFYRAESQQYLSLDQCRTMALEHNQALKMAKENMGVASSLRKAAFTQFLPDFGFTGGYAHSTKKLGLLSENQFLPVIPYSAITADGTLDQTKLGANDIVINPVTHQPVLDKNGNPVFQKYAYIPKDAFSIDLTNVYSMGFGMTQPIFTGGKILNLYKSAKIMERIAWSNQSLETSELLYKVEEAYWRVTAVGEKVKLASEYKKLIDKLIFDLENYEKEGIIINNDLLKARVRQTEAELSELKAGNGLTLSKMALCQVIGLPLDAAIETVDTILPVNLSIGAPALTQNALANRQELAILRENVNLSEAGVGMMKSRFLPDIGLTAGYGWMNPTPYNGFEKEFEGDLSIGVVCKIPLWHWGERIHTLHAAQHTQKENELKLNETMEMISLQVRQAQFRSMEAYKKTELTARSLSQARENLRVTTDKFAEGILKTTDVLEAQTMWQNAWSENIDAKSDLQITSIYLKKVRGELQQENK